MGTDFFHPVESLRPLLGQASLSPDFPAHRATVAVIGAGLSGLSSARALSAAGIEVTVLEKPRCNKSSSKNGNCRRTRYLGQASVENLPDGFFVTADVRTKSRVEPAWIAGRTTASETLAWLKFNAPVFQQVISRPHPERHPDYLAATGFPK